MIQRIRSLKFIVSASSALLVFTLLAFYGYQEPGSYIGFQLFRIRYAVSPDKPRFLQSFSDELKEVEGGYLPQPIDVWLIRRFGSATSANERNGIVDFYVHQQGRGRPGNHMHEMGERFVALLFQRLPLYDTDHKLAAIAAVEGCRRANVINKYQLTPLARAVWGQKLPLDTVVAAYVDWWKSPLQWSQKVTVSPDLSFDWSEP